MRDPPVTTYFSRIIIAKIVYNSIDQKIDFFYIFQADFFILINVSTVSTETI